MKYGQELVPQIKALVDSIYKQIEEKENLRLSEYNVKVIENLKENIKNIEYLDTLEAEHT